MPCIIVVLLLVGGIDLNPGLTVMKLAKKFEEFVASYQSMHDHLQAAVPALWAKLDHVFTELSKIINSTNEALKQ